MQSQHCRGPIADTAQRSVVIDVIATGQQRGDQGHRLLARIGGAGDLAQMHMRKTSQVCLAPWRSSSEIDCVFLTGMGQWGIMQSISSKEARHIQGRRLSVLCPGGCQCICS